MLKMFPTEVDEETIEFFKEIFPLKSLLILLGAFIAFGMVISTFFVESAIWWVVSFLFTVIMSIIYCRYEK